MDKFENKIYQKYLKMIKSSVVKKYKKIANNQALEKKIYLDKENCSNDLIKLRKDIYNSYLPIIEDEITNRINNVLNSGKFDKAVNAERELSKKVLHYKALKKYQKLPIHISEEFLDILSKEVNLNVDSKDIIKKEELRYLTLLILYSIIDNIKQGYRIKFGTLFRIWCDKMDFVSNLPKIENKIYLNRLKPKVKLCKSFDNKLFNRINEDNEAIINYYKAKTERLLILLKIKRSNSGE